MSTLRPLHDRVLIQREEASETSAGGIIMVGGPEKENTGTVCAAGPGRFIDGEYHGMSLKIGDKVIFTKHRGTEVKIEGETYLLMTESDVLAIFED